MKKVNLFLIPVAITAFAITSCGNKEISKEEAGNVVKKAAAKEIPEYTTITLTTELVKYKFDIKGEGLEGLGISQEDFAKLMDELEFEENRQMLAEISQQLYKSILEFGIAEARLDNDCKTMKQMIANLQLGNI